MDNGGSGGVGGSASSSSMLTHVSATHALSNAVVKRAVLIEHKSTFRIPLGVSISCLPSTEMTGFGEAFCYTVLPESTNNVPLSLYEASDEGDEGAKWRRDYPKYHSGNLETHGTLDAKDCIYTFVHKHHPAIALLRGNKELLGCDIDKQAMIDDEWYKVQQAHFCCGLLL